MASNSSTQINAVKACNIATDFNGGAVIDDNGKETPITEKMIQLSCKKMAETCFLGRCFPVTPDETKETEEV